jgi:DNA polymerase-1
MQMEIRGMKLDVPLIDQYSEEAKRHYRRAEKKLFRMAGFEINPRSPKQLCKFLGTTSSAKEILEQLDTPEAEALTTYRAWNKVDVDYYQKWLRFMDKDEVLHPNLLLHGTGTGRQSAREPPLHGTPRYRKEYKVKDVIVPREGYTIVSADYNQMELRIAASISKEEKMVQIFAEGGDVHRSVAEALHIPDPAGRGRETGKSINFMMLYGGGAVKLAKMAKIPFEVSELYIHNYRTTYWKLRYASKHLSDLAKNQGYIRLWTGRVRHFNHPIFADPKDAFNSAVQGGGAEMLRIAIGRMGPQLRDLGAWILLQIHDQVLVEVPLTQIKPCLKIIRREMEDFHHWLVPPKVDFKIGPRWGQLEKLEAA